VYTCIYLFECHSAGHRQSPWSPAGTGDNRISSGSTWYHDHHDHHDPIMPATTTASRLQPPVLNRPNDCSPYPLTLKHTSSPRTECRLPPSPPPEPDHHHHHPDPPANPLPPSPSPTPLARATSDPPSDNDDNDDDDDDTSQRHDPANDTSSPPVGPPSFHALPADLLPPPPTAYRCRCLPADNRSRGG